MTIGGRNRSACRLVGSHVITSASKRFLPARTVASRKTTVALAAAAVVAAGIAPAVAGGRASAAPTFGRVVALPAYAGGEPSLAVDHRDPRNVFVTAPQGIPAGVGGVLGAAPNGVGFWASRDGGRSFPTRANVGSAAGGGDSDVEVGSDGTVYVADLEAAAAAVCTSTDHGRSFTSGNPLSPVDRCNGVTSNQEGPENDRPWLTSGRRGEIYLTYHDFAAGFPVILRSDDKGATFTPCGTVLNPSGPAGQNYTPTGGTLVAKPAIDRSGRMFVEVTEPDRTASPVGASLNHLFIAVADRGCAGGTVFRNYSVYSNPGADLGKIFNAVTTDGAGPVYVIAAGVTGAGQKTTNVWLFVSHNHGVTWSRPIRVNTPNLRANVMPALVGGLRGNEVAVSWFGTSSSGDPNYPKNQWRYYAATSFDGGRHFTQTTVTPRPIHYGDICTEGLACGATPGGASNRNLADFASIAVDPRTGQLLLAFPGDPYNRPDINGKNTGSSTAYVTRQVGGRPLR